MRKLLYPVSVASAVFAVVAGGLALAAQDWSALKVPGGLAISEFGGYRTWQVVAPSQTENSIKVIAANEVMMKAYRAGLPAKVRARLKTISKLNRPLAANRGPINASRLTSWHRSARSKAFPRASGSRAKPA